MPLELNQLTPERKVRLHFHPGQLRAWTSAKRFVCVLAGTQGGKTSFGPYWLYREIQARGPGDYMIVSTTLPLAKKKVLPEFLRLFKRQMQLGEYQTQDKIFTFSADGQRRVHGAECETPTRVFVCHATDPESLESATAKAAWLDEAGQKMFRLDSWEAVQRRLAIHQGRALITTTPYDLAWIKQRLFDPWQAAGGQHPEIDVIRFDSTENPTYPREEFERARNELPRWKFDMFYRAIFTRPAGLIYDCFQDAFHKIPPFNIQATWKRYLGLDFGGVNTAGVFFAEEPLTKHWYAYREYKAGGRTAREYKAGGRTAREHVAALLKDEPGLPTCFGGAGSEDNWRGEFRAAGLPVREPDVKEVEVGIDRVYGAIKRGEIFVFSTLQHWLDEAASYSRELDARGEPTEKIADKETFHLMDATRYIVGSVKRQGAGGPINTTAPRERPIVPRDVYQDANEGRFFE